MFVPRNADSGAGTSIRLALVAFVAGLIAPVSAQIRVIAPHSLIEDLGDTHGQIEGSTATFGAPFYGDRVLGRLVYGEPKKNAHCDENDYDVPKPHETQSSQYSFKEVDLINIVLVRRGLCSFTTKVRVAMNKGAHAVIIVDKADSTLTAADMKRIIVADDGYGDTIHIPSILIAKDEGGKLISAVQSNPSVVIELKWSVPTNHIVDIDVWMSSASLESMKFMRSFAPKRRTLNEVVRFHPHYAVFSLPKDDPHVYNELCSDESANYCAEDPDGSGLITGKMVLEEDVRQLCIHDITKVERMSRPLQPGKTYPVEYAEKYWDYVQKFLDSCPLDAPEAIDRFGIECSERLMQKLGIDVEKVQRCMFETKEKKLKNERENPAWSPRAVRINGWRYSGILEADLVTRAICAGFVTQPHECYTLLKPRDPVAIYKGAPAQKGVGWFTFFSVLFVAGCLTCLAMLLYKRHLKKDVRTVLREEVMLEVQAQMGEYSKLQA